MSRAGAVFPPREELALDLLLWTEDPPEAVLCRGFFLPAGAFRLLSASGSVIQALGWGGSGGRSLSGAGGGLWEESCPALEWETELELSSD